MRVTIVNSSKQKVGSFEIQPRTFKTGSRGFWGGTKMVDPETKKRYQVHAQLVEIGSKRNSQPNRPESKNK